MPNSPSPCLSLSDSSASPHVSSEWAVALAMKKPDQVREYKRELEEYERAVARLEVCAQDLERGGDAMERREVELEAWRLSLQLEEIHESLQSICSPEAQSTSSPAPLPHHVANRNKDSDGPSQARAQEDYEAESGRVTSLLHRARRLSAANVDHIDLSLRHKQLPILQTTDKQLPILQTTDDPKLAELDPKATAESEGTERGEEEEREEGRVEVEDTDDMRQKRKVPKFPAPPTRLQALTTRSNHSSVGTSRAIESGKCPDCGGEIERCCRGPQPSLRLIADQAALERTFQKLFQSPSRPLTGQREASHSVDAKKVFQAVYSDAIVRDIVSGLHGDKITSLLHKITSLLHSCATDDAHSACNLHDFEQSVLKDKWKLSSNPCRPRFLLVQCNRCASDFYIDQSQTGEGDGADTSEDTERKEKGKGREEVCCSACSVWGAIEFARKKGDVGDRNTPNQLERKGTRKKTASDVEVKQLRQSKSLKSLRR